MKKRKRGWSSLKKILKNFFKTKILKGKIGKINSK